jgi:hypothetical protein
MKVSLAACMGTVHCDSAHRELPSQPPDSAKSGLKAVLRLRLTRTILRVMAHGSPDSVTARALLMDIPENPEHPKVQLLFGPALAAAAAAAASGSSSGSGRGAGRALGATAAAGSGSGGGSNVARPTRKTGTRASSRTTAQPESEKVCVCLYTHILIVHLFCNCEYLYCTPLV